MLLLASSSLSGHTLLPYGCSTHAARRSPYDFGLGEYQAHTDSPVSIVLCPILSSLRSTRPLLTFALIVYSLFERPPGDTLCSRHGASREVLQCDRHSSNLKRTLHTSPANVSLASLKFIADNDIDCDNRPPSH